MKEASEFEDDEFGGFCIDFEQNGRRFELIRKGVGNEEYIINTLGEETKEWKDAAKKAHEMREELRTQFELKTSYGELRNQLEEWEEDKKWKEREESNRREGLGQILPIIPEEEIEIAGDNISHNLDDLEIQKK